MFSEGARSGQRPVRPLPSIGRSVVTSNACPDDIIGYADDSPGNPGRLDRKNGSGHVRRTR